MKNFLHDLDTWRELLEHKPLALFLDYDGTLSAIASTPAEAVLPAQTRKILKDLIKLPAVKVAIVSGRALAVLQEMVKVPGLSYVGSHGSEFFSPGMPPRNVAKEYCRILQGLEQVIPAALDDRRGILFEHKPVSFAVHYRKASVSVEKSVKRIVLDACRDPLRKGLISIINGKKVIEIVPPDSMNKGQAVERLWGKWEKKKFFPVFIGDDRTDESAFEVLRGHGLTIRVGASNAVSQAVYCLDSVGEVRTFLRKVISFRNKNR